MSKYPDTSNSQGYQTLSFLLTSSRNAGFIFEDLLLIIIALMTGVKVDLLPGRGNH
ncbi:hypothetical protein ACTJIJ_17950 [Niabella sp. 22666]|uniref:hypothetical protein n=1 Tax=Niabella sp. 22666 TaxID=3453954 RepID=UPI003F827666